MTSATLGTVDICPVDVRPVDKCQGVQAAPRFRPDLSSTGFAGQPDRAIDG